MTWLSSDMVSSSGRSENVPNFTGGQGKAFKAKRQRIVGCE